MLPSVSLNETCTMIGPGGGIGRHAGLKIQWPSRPYGFKSRPGYTQNKKPCIIRYGAFLLVLDQIGATVLNSFYPLSQLRFRGSTFLGILKQ